MVDFTFGVEIEFHTSANIHQVADAMVAAGFDARAVGYSTTVNGYWGVKPDGSVPGGLEVVSPILHGDEGRETLRRAMEVVRRQPRARTSQYCGVHVHIAPNGRSFAPDEVSKIARRWVNFEDTLDLLQPQSRRGNSNRYCQSNARMFDADYRMASREMWRRLRHVRDNQQLADIISPSRYVKLNLRSLTRHGTIEFRHSAGTIDPNKVDHWVRFLLAFSETACKQTRLWRRSLDAPETVQDRFRKLMRGVPADVKAFYVRRIRTLNDGLDLRSAV
jgi:hypothetical protein